MKRKQSMMYVFMNMFGPRKIIGLPKVMKRKAPKMKAPKGKSIAKVYKVVRTKKSLKVQMERIIDLEDYGIYRSGLTDVEIKEYLKNRYNVGAEQMCVRKRRVCTKAMYKRFCNIAGVNTMTAVSVYNTKGRSEFVSLMYREDVRRFADLMFDGISTYFD